MVKKITRERILFIAFFIITISNSSYFIKIGINELIEYAGLFILLSCISVCFLLEGTIKKKIGMVGRTFFCIVFFCTGICFQGLDIRVKLRLIISMLILAFLACMSESMIRSFSQIRSASLGIFCGCMGAGILGIFTRVSFFTIAETGLVEYGFNCGMEHKNYFAYAMIASFIGIFLHGKLEGWKKGNWFFLVVESGLLLSANTRGAWLVFVAFIMIANVDYVNKKIPEKKRTAFWGVIIVTAMVAALCFFVKYALNSETYMYRVRGILNYIHMYSGDMFHLMFGNAEMAFRDSGMDYNKNIKSVVGWDGATDIAWLNIMIKNGILGVLAYIFIFLRLLVLSLKTHNKKYKIASLPVLLSFLLTSLVEPFIANVHWAYGPFCYCVLGGLCGLICEEISRKKKMQERQ